MKKKSQFCWIVKRYNINNKTIENYNILQYNKTLIKNLKKETSNREEFSEKLKREMMYYYWSKCEWELIIYIGDNGNVYLSPWIGDKTIVADVTLDKSFDWVSYAKTHIDGQICENKAKIDVYDQLRYKWEEFVDYCLYTHLPYERKGWWNND